MDDCNLEKLSIKPGKLSPVFHMGTTEYNATVGSNVDKTTLDCLTRDTGASYNISNSGGEKTVPLKEGEVNDIKIEVTAEDGTTKTYCIHVRRLSARDATLSNLAIDIGSLSPEFSPEVVEYNVLLPVDRNSVTITPSVPDVKAAVTVNNEKAGTPVPLNLSNTLVDIQVTSPDESNKQTYKVVFTRKQVPRYIRFANSNEAMQYECPISLTALYQPITIKDSDPKHSFSAKVIDELTKTSKVDPITEMPLPGDWRIEDFDLDKKMSDVTGCIPLINGACSSSMKLSELGTKIKDCNQTSKLNVDGVKYNTEAEVKHTVQVKKWERQLQQVYDESNFSKLCKAAENYVQKYYESLPQPGRTQRYNEGESPLEHLTNAAYNYATAIQQKGSDANIHMQLGLVLEEKYYAEDLFGLKKDEDSAPGFASLNMAAKESSKEEECDAICALRGVGANAPLSLKLKAIDQEYHHLIENGQGDRAEHVQHLFQWKSKQATQEGGAAQKASDDTSPLGQASLKYLDALSLDEAKSVYNFHVGRTMVIQGEYDNAVKRLEAALGWNEKHQMAKFYLGFGLCLQKGGPGGRVKEVVGYLTETLESLLQQNTEAALKIDTSQGKATLHAENLLRNNNVHLLRGFIQLGKLLRANTDIKDCMSAIDVFHNAALLSSQVLPSIVRGDSYKQVEWVILEAHSQLLEILLESQKDNKKLIAQRCLRLSALINHFTIPQNPQLLALQMKTCQMLIEIQPCSSHALYMLGSSQFVQFENDPESEDGKRLLEEAKSSLKTSIALEGKPTAGEMPSEITGQKWWQDKIKAEEEKKKAAEAKNKPAAPAKGTPVGRGGVTAARGAPAGRGGPTAARGGARGGAAAARGGAARGGATAGRGAPAARGGAKAAAPARGGAAAAKAGSPAAAKPASAKGTRPPSAKKSHSCEAITPDKDKAKAQETTNTAAAPSSTSESSVINKKTHHARLGLARALAKNTDDLSEAKKYYNEVIDIAPEVHDAYVESAELLAIKDPMGAVDIYCRFPVSENPTFDDAYIFGEIVRILMKHEKFDDPRLQTNLIAMGKVMGLRVLEKYLGILDNKFKTKLLKEVYAGVNGRSVDDPDMQTFFKAKCWL